MRVKIAIKGDNRMDNYKSDESHSYYIGKQQKLYMNALEYPFTIMRHTEEGIDDSSICLIKPTKGGE